MSSTYKPVFLRALLDIGDLSNVQKTDKLAGRQWLELKNDNVLVDLNFIAIRFAKYYWDMEYSFRLKQSQDPQDANITRIIRATHKKGKKPPTIEELATEKMSSFRSIVISKSIRPEVLKHLLSDMDGLYRKTDSRTISLDKSIIQFLYEHKIILRKSINNVLTKYLERLNRMTPQIANKIDCVSRSRPRLSHERRMWLKKWQRSRCFYCDAELQKEHVDHVVPFNYVFATDLYNCTLACQQCNCQKSDMLPNRDLFDNVVKRNKRVIEYLNQPSSTYDEEAYVHLFDVCEKEYNRGLFFSPKARL